MIPLDSVDSSEQELSLDNSQYEKENTVFRVTNGIWDIVKVRYLQVTYSENKCGD